MSGLSRYPRKRGVIGWRAAALMTSSRAFIASRCEAAAKFARLVDASDALKAVR
jgi:hypothetical protein